MYIFIQRFCIHGTIPSRNISTYYTLIFSINDTYNSVQRGYDTACCTLRATYSCCWRVGVWSRYTQSIHSYFSHVIFTFTQSTSPLLLLQQLQSHSVRIYLPRYTNMNILVVVSYEFLLLYSGTWCTSTRIEQTGAQGLRRVNSTKIPPCTTRKEKPWDEFPGRLPPKTKGGQSTTQIVAFIYSVTRRVCLLSSGGSVGWVKM